MRGAQKRGIALMLLAALLTCLGQLCWKLGGGGELLWLLPGFALYGCGALLMIVAMRFGELSVLHPMLSAGYVLSVALNRYTYNEEITPVKLLGIGAIILGLVCITRPGKGERR